MNKPKYLEDVADAQIALLQNENPKLDAFDLVQKARLRYEAAMEYEGVSGYAELRQWDTYRAIIASSQRPEFKPDPSGAHFFVQTLEKLTNEALST